MGETKTVLMKPSWANGHGYTSFKKEHTQLYTKSYLSAPELYRRYTNGSMSRKRFAELCGIKIKDADRYAEQIANDMVD